MKNFLLAISMSMACTAFGGHMLFDFEKEEDAKLWTKHSNPWHWMEYSDQYATSGSHSLHYQAKKFGPGMPEWPSFEVPSPLQDWTEYDRIVIDITNVKLLQPYLSFYVSDSKVPVRQAFLHKCQSEIFPCRSQRLVIPLKFPDTVNLKDIRVFHIFTERPAEDIDIYIDRIMLLKPGEEAGDVPQEWNAQLLKKRLELVEPLIREQQEAFNKLIPQNIPPAIQQGVGATIGKLLDENRRKQDELFAKLRDPQTTPQDVVTATSELKRIPEIFKRPVSIIAFAESCVKAGLDITDMLVGVSTGMEKILPKDMPVTVRGAAECTVALAQNEKEAVQVTVMPLHRDLTNVSIRLSPLLKDGTHEVYPPADVQINTVGYVETKNPPPYTVDYVGWWPDPILDFCPSVAVKQGELQSFWIRAHARRGQTPGVYRGTLTVQADNVQSVQLPFSVTVFDFALPDQPPLPTAIAWNHPTFEKTAMPQRGGIENWPKMKFVYADFLTDYLLDWGNIYIKTPPDFEVIQYLHDKGKLTAFGLGDATVWEEDKIPAEIERLRPIYEEAKRRNLLKYAYIYAYDECQPDRFPLIEKCAKALKEAFPDVLLMTTSYDHSFGANTVVKSIDAWCPLTPSFDVAKVDAAHASGRYVWWYICCGPHHPHANWFVEYPAQDIRTLMGAQTAKYQPDGFLYYSMTIWNDNKPIVTGPYTTWNPVSWTTYHGDGCIFCFGKDGRPIPTIRLENYRDGLEDYAYHCILREAVRRMKLVENRTAEQTAWLEEAEKSLVVPNELVQNMAVFTQDPKVTSAWRLNMAKLIERSGFHNLDPWKDGGFAVRGWRGIKK